MATLKHNEPAAVFNAEGVARCQVVGEQLL